MSNARFATTVWYVRQKIGICTQFHVNIEVLIVRYCDDIEVIYEKFNTWIADFIETQIKLLIKLSLKKVICSLLLWIFDNRQFWQILISMKILTLFWPIKFIKTDSWKSTTNAELRLMMYQRHEKNDFIDFATVTHDVYLFSNESNGDFTTFLFFYVFYFNPSFWFHHLP